MLKEKGIRGGICHTIYRYVKADNKYRKDYEKKESSIVMKHIFMKLMFNTEKN